MDKFIQNLVIGSGKILKKKFKASGIKGKAKTHELDVVTEADLAAEKFIISQIKRKFPDHQILSEEAGNNNLKSDSVWVIDPLDGTLNYSRGIPYFVSQVAYIKNGQIELSAIYDPIHDQLYFAKRNKGAFCNGKRIYCSQSKDISKSILGSSASWNTDVLQIITKIVKNVPNPKLRIRNMGSIGQSACDTASGKVEYYIVNSGNFWDHAPTYLLLKESGCIVKNIKGKEWEFTDRSMVAGNKELISKIFKAADIKI